MSKRAALLFALLLALVAAADPASVDRPPLVSLGLIAAPSEAPTPGAVGRVQLFRVQPAFLVNMPWLDQDDRVVGGPPEPDTGPEWITLLAGNDNPYFDFRDRREPGGVGYNRIVTQIQLFDDARTACSLVLNAVTPAGTQFDGVPDHAGPTVLTPALSLYHQLEDGTAVQFCVNKHVGVSNQAAQPFRRDLQCGLAVARPVTTDERDPLRWLYVSVEALGQYRTERAPVTWDVLPGLHWQPGENWRVSGALSVPMDRGDATLNVRYWQITCAVQF
jgi:hypothetical protein